jgi:hypothetical protein
MSSLWTPDGERPVHRNADSIPASRHGVTEAPDLDESDAMAEEFRQLEEQLANTPAYAVIANHCIGMFQLAALHLQRDTPNLSDARLSIDALAAVVDACKGRLGPDESVLADALSQIKMAYVQTVAKESD